METTQLQKSGSRGYVISVLFVYLQLETPGMSFFYFLIVTFQGTLWGPGKGGMGGGGTITRYKEFVSFSKLPINWKIVSLFSDMTSGRTPGFITSAPLEFLQTLYQRARAEKVPRNSHRQKNTGGEFSACLQSACVCTDKLLSRLFRA